ncbi:MAG: hypothetical protein EOO01_00215 [Chitinophagaceae bacterium]|nr:MAG: hypothetical protein EOO01_00215 [Chitinophagaceae bacterium]
MIWLLFQDWKLRKIHVALPVAIFILSFILVDGRHRLYTPVVLYNIAFFILLLGILTVYMSVRNRRFLNPFQNYFGLGDLLFFIAVSPLFFLQNYIIYIILSMVFALVLHLVFRKAVKSDMIPLAGFSSLLLIVVILKDSFLDWTKMTLL